MLPVDQGHIIDTLNKKLLQLNFSPDVLFNAHGVCQGLATVYAKYALEKKETDFVEMLQLIASEKMSNERFSEHDVYVFAAEVLMAFNPSLYDLQFCQGNSMELLKINEKNLKSSFVFGITTTEKNWEDIVRQIDLQENEVAILSGYNHAIAVKKEANQYKVYDPNYPDAFEYLNTETELIKELRSKVFQSGPGPLAMQIQVIRHPEEVSERKFPKASELFEKYYSPPTQYIGKPPTSLKTVYYYKILGIKDLREEGELKAILSMMNLNKEEILQAACIAIDRNNPVLLKFLLPEITDQQDFDNLFDYVTHQGRYEAFEVMEPYLSKCSKEKNISLLYSAAWAGNPRLLKKILEINDLNSKDAEKAYETCWDATRGAIYGGSYDCVKIMVDQLNKLENTSVDYSELLSLAIEKNKVEVVRGMLDIQPQFSEEDLSNLRISRLTVYKTDYWILDKLQEKGAVFDKLSLKIIESKRDRRSIDIKTGIELFLDKLQEFIWGGSRNAISTQDYKNSLQNLKQSDENDTPAEHFETKYDK